MTREDGPVWRIGHTSKRTLQKFALTCYSSSPIHTVVHCCCIERRPSLTPQSVPQGVGTECMTGLEDKAALTCQEGKGTKARFT